MLDRAPGRVAFGHLGERGLIASAHGTLEVPGLVTDPAPAEPGAGMERRQLGGQIPPGFGQAVGTELKRAGRGWPSGSRRVRLCLHRAVWEVPVMAGPDQGALAGRGQLRPGRGQLRAAQADREQAITVLKTAYAQGRLTKDELEVRAGQAFASRTYAELAALTADIPGDIPGDIPADSPTASPGAAGRPGTPARTMAKAAGRSGVCILAAVALAEAGFLTGNFLLIVAASFALIAASGFFGYGILDAWQERRSRGRLPTGRPGQGQPKFERRLSRDNAAPTGISPTRADQTRAESRARRPVRDRRHLSRGGVPVPVRLLSSAG